MAKKQQNQAPTQGALKLAASEYMNRFLTTGDVLEAEHAYRKTLASLDAEIPGDLENRAIHIRQQFLDILEPEIKRVKRAEWKEFELLHYQLRRMLLKDDVAETGIPDKLCPEQLKDMTPESFTHVINSMVKLHEMRREILNSTVRRKESRP